jgi:AraC-like DNA-binding protein
MEDHPLPEVIQQMQPKSSWPPRLYRLLKIHKEGTPPPLQLTVSTTAALTYCLTQYLARQLKEYMGSSPCHVRHTREFINII